MKLARYRHGALDIDGWSTSDGEFAIYRPLAVSPGPEARRPGMLYPILWTGSSRLRRLSAFRVEHLASGYRIGEARTRDEAQALLARWIAENKRTG